jgi:hypothetical protein
MANDNGNGKLWDAVAEAVRDVCGGHGVDQLASTLLARHPDLMRPDESFSGFVDRLRTLLQRKGLLDGDSPGASLKAVSSRLLRELAGLPGGGDDEDEAAAMSLESANPGHGAARHARPEPTAADVQLSLDTLPARAAQEAAARAEQEAAANVLLGRMSAAALGQRDTRGR